MPPREAGRGEALLATPVLGCDWKADSGGLPAESRAGFGTVRSWLAYCRYETDAAQRAGMRSPSGRPALPFFLCGLLLYCSLLVVLATSDRRLSPTPVQHENVVFSGDSRVRGGSSVGRALRSQCRGRGFDSLSLHYTTAVVCTRQRLFSLVGDGAYLAPLPGSNWLSRQL